MKKHVLLVYLLVQTSILCAVEVPEIGSGAFTFIRNAATGVPIDLDEIEPSIIQEVGHLIDPEFNINYYNRARDPITKVRFLFRFRNNPVRTFTYNGEHYTLKSERVSNPTKAVTCVTRFTLRDANNQIVKRHNPHHATPAIEPTKASLKENDTGIQPKAGDDPNTPNLEPKWTPMPRLCSSFCKALCAATIAGVVVYYAFDRYNNNTKNQQHYSPKKWALGCATVIGLSTFVYVHFNTSQ